MTDITRRKAVLLSLAAPLASSGLGCRTTAKHTAEPESADTKKQTAPPNPLSPPTDSSIPVAFLLSKGAVVIDFCGPWEVFERVPKPKGTYDAFKLYTVAATKDPIRTAGGMKIVPEYASNIRSLTNGRGCERSIGHQ